MVTINRIPQSPYSKKSLDTEVLETKIAPSGYQEDLLQATKAIHDSLKNSLGGQIKSLEDKVQGFDSEIVLRIGKMFQREFESRIAGMEKNLEVLQKSHDDSISSILQLLKSLPIPQVSVTVPDKAIEVKQLPSQVTIPKDAITVNVQQKDVVVNIPKQDQPKIEVAAPSVTVNVPEQKPADIHVNVPRQDTPVVNVAAPNVTIDVPKQEAPTVNVNVPEQKPADVQVSVPPPRLVKKTFAYDEQGRPTTVTEEEIKE